MARTTLRRRTPAIERLEERQVLTAGGPTHEVAYAIELLNLVRTNPAEGAKWVEQNADADVQVNLKHYGIDLNQVKAEIAAAQPRQPLAFNSKLNSAAQGHADDMARNKFQSHTSSDGKNLDARLDAAGYTDRVHATENAFAYARSIENAMEAFLIDWGVADKGHRRNIQEPDDTNDRQHSDEVGIGLSEARGSLNFGPLVVVQNFGTRQSAPGQLVGVVFEDANKDGRFSYKEGRGDAAIVVRDRSGAEVRRVLSWDAGSYQTPLDPGDYVASLEVDGQVLDYKPFQMGTSNVKIDFNLTELRQAKATVATKASAQVIKTSNSTQRREADRQKQQQDDAARRQQDAQRRQQDEAAAKQKAQDEAARQKAQDEAAARQKAQDEAAARQKAQDEAAAKQKAQDDARRAKDEADRQKKQQDEAAARKAQEAENAAKQKAQDEAPRKATSTPPSESTRSADSENRTKAKETQMLEEAIALGLLGDSGRITVKSASVWNAKASQSA